MNKINWRTKWEDYGQIEDDDLLSLLDRDPHKHPCPPVDPPKIAELVESARYEIDHTSNELRPHAAYDLIYHLSVWGKLPLRPTVLSKGESIMNTIKKWYYDILWMAWYRWHLRERHNPGKSNLSDEFINSFED